MHAFPAADEREVRRILKFIKDFATARSLIAGRAKHGGFNDKRAIRASQILAGKLHRSVCIAKANFFFFLLYFVFLCDLKGLENRYRLPGETAKAVKAPKGSQGVVIKLKGA